MLTTASRLGFLIFFLFFSFSFLLLQNLPFTFGDDLNIVYIAKITDWSKLIGEFVHPFTQALYVHGLSCQLSTRVFQTLIFKLSYLLGGYQVNFFWLHKALAYGFCCSGVFAIVSHFSKKIYPGAFAAMFIGFCTPVILSMAWLADTEVVAQAFLIMSLYIFIRLADPAFNGSKIKTAVLLVGYFLAAWAAMKLKETARIIPLITLGYLILTWKGDRGPGKALRSVLLILSGILFLSIIPGFREAQVVIDTKSHGVLQNLSVKGLMTVAARLFDYFFIPSAVLIFYAILGFFTRFNFPKPAAVTGKESPLWIVLALWTLFSLAGFTLGFDIESNPRYMTTPMIPLGIVMFILLGRAFERVVEANGRILTRIFSVFFLIACLFQGFPGSKNGFFVFKLDEVLYARNFWGGTDIAIFKMASRVYSDYYGRSEPTWQDLHHFFHHEKNRFSGMQLKEWDINQKFDNKQLSESFTEWGALYVYSFSPDLETRYSWLNKIYEDTTDNNSFYSGIIKKIKKKAVRRFYLYKAAAIPASL